MIVRLSSRQRCLTYLGLEDLGHKDVVLEEVLSSPEEVLFKVLGTNVRELSRQRSSVVYLRAHIDDVADVTLVVLVLPAS